MSTRPQLTENDTSCDTEFVLAIETLAVCKKALVVGLNARVNAFPLKNGFRLRVFNLPELTKDAGETGFSVPTALGPGDLKIVIKGRFAVAYREPAPAS